MREEFDPVESFASMRHEFGEHGGVNMSIEASTAFTVMNAGMLPALFQGRRGPERGCFLYGRHFNPTVYVLGKQLAALEGAEDAYCTASGMSAIAATIMQLCDSGDHVIASNAIYGGTYALFHDYLPAKTGIRFEFVDTSDLAAVDRAFRTGTEALYVETLSNPTLRVADIPRLAELAHAHGAKLVVDNTFAPLAASPVRLGADIVVQSLTKFVNGASDLIAGAICGPTEFMKQLMDLHSGSLMLLGPTMDPKLAFELSMRLPHLGLRMAEHSRRALVFATRLRERGLSVTYPGLADHPDHELARQLFNEAFGFGGILTVDLSDARRASEFMEILQNKDRFGFMAVSLGFFDTLMCCPASSTASEMPPDQQVRSGIRPGLVRLSIGYTGSLEQRWRQLADALEMLESTAVGR